MNPVDTNPLAVFAPTETEKAIEDRRAILRKQAEEELATLKPLDQQTSEPSANLKQEKVFNGKYPVTQGFMNYNPAIEKYSGGYNTGVDFAVPMNTPVALPSGNWVVKEATQGSFNKGYGNSVLAVNADTGEQIRFSHLSRINANPGQNLQGTSIVGYSGSTGNSTGPHVDIEYYTKGGKPASILASSYANELWQ